MPDIFFEDVIVGDAIRTLPYVLPEGELMSFAAAWDPMPMHTDKDFAAAHDGLTAPGIYLLAVKMRLVHSLPVQRSVIASFGYDEVRFHRPARPMRFASSSNGPPSDGRAPGRTAGSSPGAVR